MSVHVTTQLKTRAEHTEQVVAALSEALPHSLQHEGCEAIHLRQDQDDPPTSSRSPDGPPARTTRTTSLGEPRPE